MSFKLFSNLFQNQKVKDGLFLTGLSAFVGACAYDTYKTAKNSPATAAFLLFGKPSFGSSTQEHVNKVMELQKKMDAELPKPL